MRPSDRAARSLLWGLFASWVAMLLRKLLFPKRMYAAGWQAPLVAKPIPLHRDPWCGVYISPEISVRLEKSGDVQHFCSAECRDRYTRFQQTATSA